MSAVHDLTTAEVELFARTVHDLTDDGRTESEIREGVLERLLVLLRADQAASYVWDEAAGRFDSPVSVNEDPADVDRYLRWFQFRDPLPARLRHRRRATLVDDVLPRRELEQTDFYRDFLAPAGVCHGVNMFLVDATGRDVGDLRFWRRADRPAFDRRELALLDGLGPFLQRALVHAVRSAPGLLTARERQVCDLVSQGLADKQIASALGISFGTVRTHISNSMVKFSCTNRVELAVAVLRATRSA